MAGLEQSDLPPSAPVVFPAPPLVPVAVGVAHATIPVEHRPAVGGAVLLYVARPADASARGGRVALAIL